MIYLIISTIISSLAASLFLSIQYIYENPKDPAAISLIQSLIEPMNKLTNNAVNSSSFGYTLIVLCFLQIARLIFYSIQNNRCEQPKLTFKSFIVSTYKSSKKIFIELKNKQIIDWFDNTLDFICGKVIATVIGSAYGIILFGWYFNKFSLWYSIFAFIMFTQMAIMTSYINSIPKTEKLTGKKSVLISGIYILLIFVIAATFIS